MYYGSRWSSILIWDLLKQGTLNEETVDTTDEANGITALSHSITSENSLNVERLLKLGPSLTKEDKYGNPLLLIIVRRLIREWTSTGTSGNHERLQIMDLLAAHLRRPENQYLLTKEFRYTTQWTKPESAHSLLWYAVKDKSRVVIKILLEAGAKHQNGAELRNMFKNTPRNLRPDVEF
jgi:hypothetical protein